MKVIALAVLTVLIALPAEAVQRQNNFSPSCNNDGRCTTFNASTASQTPSLRRHHIRTSERKPHHVVDANGNSMLVTVYALMSECEVPAQAWCLAQLLTR